MTDSTQAYLRRMVQILAPHKGDLVSFWEAYFDASNSEDKARMLAVSGFVFEPEAAVAFNAEWAAMLAEYNLPYFRMSACNSHKKPFDHLTKKQCDEVARKAIANTKAHIKYGVSASIFEGTYDVLMPKVNGFTHGSPFLWCIFMVLAGVRTRAIQDGQVGNVSYVFESGDPHQRMASRVLDSLSLNPAFKMLYRYRSHGFLAKQDALQLQAADLLAWHHVKEWKRQEAKKDMRPDFVELLSGISPRIKRVHADKDLFEDPIMMQEYLAFTFSLVREPS